MVRKYRVTVAGQTYEVEVEDLGSGGGAVRAAEKVTPQTVAPAAPTVQVATEHASRPAARGGNVLSPLPGKVLAVRAQAGQKVKRGDLLLVIEAMKMENEIFAADAGTVRKMHVSSGQSVETGDLLAELALGD
jgi:biotin carboxyl carrier protein